MSEAASHASDPEPSEDDEYPLTEYRLTKETYIRILVSGIKLAAEKGISRSDGCDMAIDQMIEKLPREYSKEQLHQMRKAIRMTFNFQLANGGLKAYD